MEPKKPRKPMKRNALGHPEKIVLTPENIKYIEAHSGLLTLDQMAQAIGISVRTLKTILATDESIDTLYRAGVAKTIGLVAGQLVKEALAGNTAAICFYLKTKGRWLEMSDEDKALRVAQAEKIKLENKLLKLRVDVAERAFVDGGSAGVFMALISDKPLTTEELTAIAEQRANEK